MGIKNIFEISAFDLKELETKVKEAVNKDEITVIITKTPCVLLNKRKRTPYQIEQNKCKKCGKCLKPGCPALSKDVSGKVKIDDTICTGCELCTQLCKAKAIIKVGE